MKSYKFCFIFDQGTVYTASSCPFFGFCPKSFYVHTLEYAYPTKRRL